MGYLNPTYFPKTTIQLMYTNQPQTRKKQTWTLIPRPSYYQFKK
jgi:hypothetical protein